MDDSISKSANKRNIFWSIPTSRNSFLGYFSDSWDIFGIESLEEKHAPWDSKSAIADSFKEVGDEICKAMEDLKVVTM